MQDNLDQLIEKISSHPLFLRLKDVIENSQGWHDHEAVFDHLIKTADIARKKINGDFITNSEAKTLFLNWMKEDVYGMKRADVAVLIALLHDCGKILHYKEGSSEEPLIVNKPTLTDQTLCPGHEFWGGAIVTKQILADLGFDEKLINYISSVIKQHGIKYFDGKEKWTTSEIVNFVKSQAEGFYKEGMFNMYCDSYTASAYIEGKKRIEEVFNAPSFYIPRTYFIPET